MVIDAFSGGRVPAELATAEFFAEVARVLRPTGIVLINTTDGPPFHYLHRLVAAVSISVAGDRDSARTGVVRGEFAGLRRRPGCAPGQSPGRWRRAPRPIQPLSGAALTDYISGAAPLTDADSMRSPIPPDDTWRVGGDF